MSEEIRLFKALQLEHGKKHIEGAELPLCISSNLNPRFALRPYQERAYKYFVNYLEHDFDGKPRQNHQLLFHMATGSGKTIMMAGAIAYLYSKGYRKFLFFVNSSNIINKTRDNFLNQSSRKYLFAPTISVGDKRVDIREVTSFQSVNMDDINIVFTTIQGLHMALNTPRENSITFDDFEGDKVVLISDEAHHINVDTKKGKVVDQDELFEVISWEGTVEKIFKSHPENILLEFTATVDFSDDNLKKKYYPKLIFDYPLKEFRIDGYSKEVKVLQADLEPFDRALQAVLLSQYRRKVFEKYRHSIKPVVMFKSRRIGESQLFFEEFKSGIKSLTANKLTQLHANSANPAMHRVFDYLKANNISLVNLITELQEDFSDDKLITVNSKEESELKQIAVNTLETNSYRAVFAVDKLNEGWDVLNLFDIVRLYDTRDSKDGKTGKTTMSEAQLIGRGARYCPFQISPEQPLFIRKYDADLDNELRICEEIYYHSAYNPKYVQELNLALQDIGMKGKETKEQKVVLKQAFRDSSFFKSGFVFLNERVKYNREDIYGLDSSVVNQTHSVSLRTGYSQTVVAFDDGAKTATTAAKPDRGIERVRKDYLLSSFGQAVLRKALHRIEFFEFANLKRHLPHLASIDEFLTSERYLGDVKAEVSGLESEINNLTQEQRLEVASQVLEVIAIHLAGDKVGYKGSKEFKPNFVNKVFGDKKLNFSSEGGDDKEFGSSMLDPTTTSYHLDLSTRTWFAFEDCFGTSEEKMLIQYIDKRYADLKKKYSDIYLLRNEKHFQLFAFDDGSPLEPDFVLFLTAKVKEKSMHYQVFIEPKGKHLLRADVWKEDFLKSIKSLGRVEQLFETRHYFVWGLPFFNSVERMPEFETGFNELLTTN